MKTVNLQLVNHAEVEVVRRALSLYRRSVYGDVPCTAAVVMDRLEQVANSPVEKVAGIRRPGSNV